MQVAAPTRSAYVPAGQGLHDDDPGFAEKKPRVHETHAMALTAADSLLAVPAGHTTQPELTCRGRELYRPWPHGVHTSALVATIESE